MAIDGKYGRVTLEHGNIGEDEPVVVFRAQDRLLKDVLDYYSQICHEAGSPKHHLDLIRESHDKIKSWQESNPTKTPESKNFATNA